MDRLLRLDAAAAPPRTLVVTSFAPGADPGSYLGNYGYSYDIVRRAFQPLFERIGEVIDVRRPEKKLEFALDRAHREGREVVHLSFRPFTDAFLARKAANILFPAWEFPDIPASDFKRNPRFNWVRTANHCSLVIPHSEFTAGNLRRAGVRVPIRVVPVPISDEYFHVHRWDPSANATLDCTAYVFTRLDVPPLEATDHEVRPGADTRWFRLKTRLTAWARRIWIKGIKPCLPRRLSNVLIAGKAAGLEAWREGETELPPAATQLNLSGVVYTTILNPDDKRKNWQDLLTAFLFALRDHDDATLVMKLATSHAASVREVLRFYDKLGIAHRCRIAFVTSFLRDRQMLELARASTYYLNASRAEGACLPVLDFLASGRPAIAPKHTAIADYFDERVGFVVESHPEPCPWPHDPTGQLSTSWHRIVWSSLCEQIARSHQVARGEPATYAQLATQAQAKMRRWASREVVFAKLMSAIESLCVAETPSNAEARADAAARASRERRSASTVG